MYLGGHVKEIRDIDELITQNFDFGEIVFRKPDELSCWQAVHLDKSSGFFYLGHGPSEGSPTNLHNLQHRYAPILMKTIDVCHDLCIELLTIHLWLDPRFIHSDVLEAKIRTLSDITDYAHKKSVQICLENLSESASDLAYVCNKIPQIKLTLDIGHGQLLTDRNASFEIIDKLFDKIAHCHFHDNLGGSRPEDDLHLPLGHGIVDYIEILKKLLQYGYDKTITIELQGDALLTSRQKLKHVLAGTLSS